MATRTYAGLELSLGQVAPPVHSTSWQHGSGMRRAHDTEGSCDRQRTTTAQAAACESGCNRGWRGALDTAKAEPATSVSNAVRGPCCRPCPLAAHSALRMCSLSSQDKPVGFAALAQRFALCAQSRCNPGCAMSFAASGTTHALRHCTSAEAGGGASDVSAAPADQDHQAGTQASSDAVGPDAEADADADADAGEGPASPAAGPAAHAPAATAQSSRTSNDSVRALREGPAPGTNIAAGAALPDSQPAEEDGSAPATADTAAASTNGVPTSSEKEKDDYHACQFDGESPFSRGETIDASSSEEALPSEPLPPGTCSAPNVGQPTAARVTNVLLPRLRAAGHLPPAGELVPLSAPANNAAAAPLPPVTEYSESYPANQVLDDLFHVLSHFCANCISRDAHALDIIAALRRVLAVLRGRDGALGAAPSSPSEAIAAPLHCADLHFQLGDALFQAFAELNAETGFGLEHVPLVRRDDALVAEAEAHLAAALACHGEAAAIAAARLPHAPNPTPTLLHAHAALPNTSIGAAASTRNSSSSSAGVASAALESLAIAAPPAPAGDSPADDPLAPAHSASASGASSVLAAPDSAPSPLRRSFENPVAAVGDSSGGSASANSNQSEMAEAARVRVRRSVSLELVPPRNAVPRSLILAKHALVLAARCGCIFSLPVASMQLCPVCLFINGLQICPCTFAHAFATPTPFIPSFSCPCPPMSCSTCCASSCPDQSCKVPAQWRRP